MKYELWCLSFKTSENYIKYADYVFAQKLQNVLNLHKTKFKQGWILYSAST